jgi:beta-glucosidase
MKRILITSILLGSFLIAGIPQAGNAPKLGKDPVKKVVAAMTLEEKAALVVGMGMNMPGGPPPSGQNGAAPAGPNGAPPAGPGNANPPAIPATDQGPVFGNTKDIVAGAAGTTYTLERLGITPMVVTDGPAGVRIDPTRANDKNTYYCTAFPVGTLLASTWDVDLVNKVGQAIGNEVLEYGADVLLGPGMNIHRDPLCGRNFEYYSEDPFVTGKIAAAMVKGIESQGVGVSIKHFAANNAETNRNSLNTIVSERALREIYLEGFRIAVQESNPWTVMSSYNLINGTYASQNPALLTSILRNDWGFKGFVMTDWFGGKDPIEQMKAGNNLLMPGNKSQAKKIVDAVKEGKLDVAILDKNVEGILNVILLSPHFKGYKFSDKPDLKAHAEVTRQAASEGMVLLKNDNSALPFGSTVKTVATFGNTSYEIIVGGTGSGQVNKAYSVSLSEGLKNDGLSQNEGLSNLYNGYLNLTKAGRPKLSGFMALMGSRPIDELIVNKDIIIGMANTCDAAIITIGRNAGEGADRKSSKGDFLLSDTERQLVNDVSAAFKAKNKKTIVILNVGGVVETASWKDLPDAILLAWQGGQETGNSIADILTGKVNPSGKLATTFPVSYEDVPSSKTFPGKELEAPKAPAGVMGFGRSVPAEVTYEDGIYVGYRYFETFKVKPSYEFGFGLSYTNFTYSNIKLSSAKFSGSITVTVDVKNSGSVAGKEVAELYLTAPASKLDKPTLELKGFAKTKLLQPGESQTLSFVIDSHKLASFDPSRSSWIADAGKYDVKVGASIDNIKLTSSFSLGKEIVVKKESASLIPKEKISELTPGK